MTPRDLVDQRLVGIRDAASRSRLAFLTITVASLAILAAAWNRYFSWYRFFAMGIDKFDETTAGYEQQQLVANWVRSQWFSLNPLGIQTGAADASFVGSLGLAIVSVWFFFCVRREHHDIANLLYEVATPPKGDAAAIKHGMGRLLPTDPDQATFFQKYAYHGVVSQMVFSVVWRHDAPIRRLTEIVRLRAKRKLARPDFVVRRALRGLFFLAPVAVLAMVVGDLASLTAMSWALTGDPLSSEFIKPALIWLRAAAMVLVAAFLGLFTRHIALGVSKFEEATVQLLHQFAVAHPAIADPPKAKREETLSETMWRVMTTRRFLGGGRGKAARGHGKAAIAIETP
jgi:hypothetical protein